MNRTYLVLVAMMMIGCADSDPSTGQMEQPATPTHSQDEAAGKMAVRDDKPDASTSDKAMTGDAKPEDKAPQKMAGAAKPEDKAPEKAPEEKNKAPEQKLCDGAAELKLRIFSAGQNDREMRGSVVRIENGAPSFGVDGKCHYFISGGWDTTTDVRNEPWREGQLDADTERALDEALPLEDIAALADCQSSDGLFDASPIVITTSSSHAACLVPGPKFMAALDAFTSRLEMLWKNAEPMKGGLWISVTQAVPGSPTTSYDWPLKEPLNTFFVPLPQAGSRVGFMDGEGHAITDPDQAQKLRAIRRMFLDEQAAKTTARDHAPLVKEGMLSGFLYMRDALPYEDDHGLLTWGTKP